MPTIRDVAAEAKVSVATVSRVLNDSGYAESETRARVLKAAADLGYRPNANWSRLKSKSSQTILFLLGNRQSFNAMHMRLLVACEKTLQARGYDLIFGRLEYSGKLRPNELVLPRMLDQTGAVDGVLLAGVHHPNLLRALEKRGVLYSLIANNFEGPADYNSVCYDDRGGVEEAGIPALPLGEDRLDVVTQVHRRAARDFVGCQLRLGPRQSGHPLRGRRLRRARDPGRSARRPGSCRRPAWS